MTEWGRSYDAGRAHDADAGSGERVVQRVEPARGEHDALGVEEAELRRVERSRPRRRTRVGRSVGRVVEHRVVLEPVEQPDVVGGVVGLSNPLKITARRCGRPAGCALVGRDEALERGEAERGPHEMNDAHVLHAGQGRVRGGHAARLWQAALRGPVDSMGSIGDPPPHASDASIIGPDVDLLDSPDAGGAALRGGALRMGAYVGGVLLSLVSVPLLVRHLGIAAFGDYAAVLSLITIVGVLTEAGLIAIAVQRVHDDGG